MENEIIEAPAVEAPVAAPTPVPETPPVEQAVPTERRDIIAAAVKNAQEGKPRLRAENGKFVTPQFPTPETTAPRPSMPKSLKLELAPHWDKTPAELQAAINQREADYEKGVQPLKAKAQQADTLLNEFKPYEQMLQQEGGSPQTAIRELLKTAAVFRSGNAGLKAQAVAQIMRQFAIPVEHLQQVLSGSAPTQPAIDPQISQLTQQVQQLTAAQQQQQNARSMKAVQSFASLPEHKHFDAVSERMLHLLKTPQLIGATEDMEESERLKLAYDAAVRLDSNVQALIATEQQAADKAKELAKLQTAKARTAAVQVKGAPAASPANKIDANDRRGTIRNAFQATR